MFFRFFLSLFKTKNKKETLTNTIRVLDPDQDVGPDLVLNCLQKQTSPLAGKGTAGHFSAEISVMIYYNEGIESSRH